MGTTAFALALVPQPPRLFPKVQGRSPHRGPHLPGASPPWATPGHPEPPLPEPEIWTLSGRPRLEADDRSLWERPRGLGSPGSQRRAGTGGPGASGSGSRASATTSSWPAGWSRDIPGLLPASAIPSRRQEGTSSGRVEPAQRAALSAAAPRGAPGRLARRGSGRKQRGAAREEEEHRKVCTGRSRLQPAFGPAGDSHGPPSLPPSVP